MEPEAPERGPEGATTIKSAIGLNTLSVPECLLRQIHHHSTTTEMVSLSSYLYYPNFYECKVTTNLNLTKPHHAIS